MARNSPSFALAAGCLALAALLSAGGCGSESPEKLLASAQGYLSKGDRDAAVIQLKRALDAKPDNAQARLLLGQTLLDAGDAAAAATELRKALELGAAADSVAPMLARAMLQSGQAAQIIGQFGQTRLQAPAATADLKTSLAAAYAQQGNLANAEGEIALALQAVPLHPAAIMVQARLKADAGQVDEALALLDSVLQKDPGNEQVGVAKGYLLWLARRDAAAAMDAHRKVLAAHPGNVAAQSEIVTLLFSQGRRAEAREEFGKLQKIAPKHPQTVFFDAQFAYVDRQYKRSRELTDALLKTIPDHYRALELAAAAEYQLGNDVQAQGFVTRALKVAPGLVLSRQILAQSYLRTSEPAKALDALAPLIEGTGADPESLALAGSAYMQLGDARRADAAFRKAKEQAPGSAKVRTAAALADLAGGRSDIALRELQSIASEDKGVRADLALISALIAKGDLRGALTATTALQAKQQDSPLPYQLRGQLQVALRDAAGARTSFEAALAKDRKYFPAVAALASMEVATGKAAAARTRVAEFLKANPSHARAAILLADVAHAAGAPVAEVVALQEGAVRADPTDREAHLTLIRRHTQFANRPAALAAAQAAAVALPNDLGVLMALGGAQLLAGDSQQAVSTYRKLAGLRPQDASVQMALAEAYLATKDGDSARRALRRAVEIDPEQLDARRGLAMLALREGKADEALATAREMQKRKPKEALGYATEGDIEVGRKNWAQAASAYRSALQYTSASEAAIKLHSVLRAGSKAAEADRWAAEWDKKRPGDPVFRFYLGDLAMSQKDYAAAETQYRAVLASQPGNAIAMNNVAWLLHRQSKPGALEMSQKANALMPNRAPLLDTLATIQAAGGKLDEAIETQRRAVAASPQDPNLKLALARYLVKAKKQDEARDLLDGLLRLGDSFAGRAEAKALRGGL